VITFKKISWQNFLSTGNTPTTVHLNDTSTTLIIGSNGAGKSTILDALCFSLYGKSFRKINKPQLINSTNDKGCLVEIEFDVGDTEWKVVRGIKPAIFKITKNGKELDQSASAVDQQKWLELNVLKMNYKSFTQIVILGSSTFVPFMQLPTSSRREVVEELLDIKIFSSMNVLIKEKIRVLKDENKTLNLKKESLKDKVRMQEDFMEEISKRGKERIDSKRKLIGELDTEIDKYIVEISLLEDMIREKSAELEDLEDASTVLRKHGNQKGKITQEMNSLAKQHKFFTENTTCPTCDQDIEESLRVNRIRDSEDRAKELQDAFSKLQNAIKEEELRESLFKSIKDEVTKLLNGINQNNTKISGCRKEIKRTESEIQTITDQLENRNTEYEKLETFKKSLEETYEQISQYSVDIINYDFAYNLMKDGGVKSTIIKKYLPLINKAVNNYLQMMDFYINWNFDEEFNETIESPIHEDFTYASFSEGEKSRIDLALILSWREIARFKNSVNTNLMIFDEVFDSSLDSNGSGDFLKIIRYVVKDANVFVISHKEGLEDKFEKVMTFVKEKGFSRLHVD
jgi:DNA repair exonuclease SbcCD ATPase subunit